MKRILMLGWEWPPYNTGGLGVASKGIAEHLARLGFQVLFVLPWKIPVHSQYVQFIFLDELAKNKGFKEDFSHPDQQFRASYYSFSGKISVGKHTFEVPLPYNDFISKTLWFYDDKITLLLDQNLDFDYIYHHDWLTFLPGYRLKLATGKKLISHIHATTHDIGAFMFSNPFIASIEQSLCDLSDCIITVSQYEKTILERYYGVPKDRIYVAHNGIELEDLSPDDPSKRDIPAFKDKKIVLYVGRFTAQKGGEFFIKSIPLVLKLDRHVAFVLVGSGDQEGYLIDLTHQLGIQRNVYFAGFLRGDSLAELYKRASVFVMPSVSEPFGISALEAASFGVPVIVSKNAGVCEALKNIFVVDFWDTQAMAHRILGLLRYRALHLEMGNHAKLEAWRMTWSLTARKIADTLNTVW